MAASITNKEYERRYPTSKADPALWAVYSHLWFCYSDVTEHRLIGRYGLTEENRRLLERCVLFLESDHEFQWPPPKFRLRYGICRLLGFGHVLRRREALELSAGDLEVWPFFKKTDYEERLARDLP
jgi:hypothetical protein